MDIQQYFARGKFLLTSEYFVMDGAKSIALPSCYGQSMTVQTTPCKGKDTPLLSWQAFNSDNECWLDCAFALNQFQKTHCAFGNSGDLESIFHHIIKTHNPFANNKNIHIKTSLDFPNNWGLGSSSTLISLISQWLDICPFDILDHLFGGSGYDIMCATADTPIVFQKDRQDRTQTPIHIDKVISNHLYFVHRNQKQSTKTAIDHYRSLDLKNKQSIIKDLNAITDELLQIRDINIFNQLIQKHEQIISDVINQPMVKDALFPDYWGAIKSLGAWGGDFILATSQKTDEETFAYFHEHGYKTVIKYQDIIA